MQYFRVAVPNVKDLQRVEPQFASKVQSATVQKFPAEWRMQNPLAQSLPPVHEAPGSAAPLTELCELFRTSTQPGTFESSPPLPSHASVHVMQLPCPLTCLQPRKFFTSPFLQKQLMAAH